MIFFPSYITRFPTLRGISLLPIDRCCIDCCWKIVNGIVGQINCKGDGVSPLRCK